MLTTPYQDCTAADAPAFARLAERLESGEHCYSAGNHLTLHQRQYASRLCCSPRPLDPWMQDVGNAVAAQVVRECLL